MIYRENSFKAILSTNQSRIGKENSPDEYPAIMLQVKFSNLFLYQFDFQLLVCFDVVVVVVVVLFRLL